MRDHALAAASRLLRRHDVSVQQHEGQALRAVPVSRWLNLALTALLVVAALTLVVGAAIAVFSAESDRIGFDLRAGYLPAAEAVRDGDSPYPDPDDPRFDLTRAYVYPPQLAIGLIPLTWIPADVAAFLVFLGSVAALVGALALVGVRDLRCYAAVFVWAPTWNALDTLNVSVALALGVALVWRFRSTLWPLAATLGLMVSVKLFLWPLLAWAGFTRRPVTAVYGALIAVGLTLGSWAAIGFAGLGDYRELLSTLGEQDSYALTAIARGLGVGSVGPAIAVIVGGALLATAVVLGRRGQEIRAFTLTVVAALALSPVVWMHYFTLLIAPLGLARPRFSPLWLLPILLWVSPRHYNGGGLHLFVPLVVVISIFALIVVRPRQRSAAEATA